MATSKNVKIKSLKKNPRGFSRDIGDGITTPIPQVSLRNVGGYFVEPHDSTCNIRYVKITDTSGKLIFTLSMHAAEKLT
jgi:hypothetical protein